MNWQKRLVKMKANCWQTRGERLVLALLGWIGLPGLLGCHPRPLPEVSRSVMSLTQTTASSAWKSMPTVPMTAAQSASFDIEVDPSATLQSIDGFGGAFNEKGWAALQLLPDLVREEVLRALFDPDTGARLNFCRVPIGASDYALSRYTLDEIPDDFAMEHFSIERDRLQLIPYIRAALKFRPDLRLWGSAWTPPTWMKTSGGFDGGNMRDDPRVYEAYALYLARFVESYQAEGLNLTAVAVQNEPLIETHYPSCLWTPQQFVTFLGDHAGPLFKKRGVRAELWLGTLQDGDYDKFPRAVLEDKRAREVVSAVGLQWDGLASVEKVRRLHPDKAIVQTETECGNWFWKPGFDPEKPQNDWAYAVFTWRKVKAFLDAGANAYMLWNLVLDERGKSIDSEKPWPQNAAVVVDSSSRQVLYTPMFYAFKHFSAFVEPLARVLRTSGRYEDAIAFQNPNGQVVLVVQSDSTQPTQLSVRVGALSTSLALPPKSFTSVVFP